MCSSLRLLMNSSIIFIIYDLDLISNGDLIKRMYISMWSDQICRLGSYKDGIWFENVSSDQNEVISSLTRFNMSLITILDELIVLLGTM